MKPKQCVVPLLERNDVAPSARQAYDHIAETRGQMGNLFKSLANSSEAMERVAALGEFIRWRSTLEPTIREASILTVANELRTVYEWTHHREAARALGLDPEIVIRDGTMSSEGDTGRTRKVLAFVRQVAAGERSVASETTEIQEILGTEALVDLVVLVGYYTLLSRVIETLQIPLEEGVAPVNFPDTADE